MNYKEYLYEDQDTGMQIIATKHVWDQARKRRIFPEDEQRLFKNMVRTFSKTKAVLEAPENTEFFVTSKMDQQSFVVAYRRDIRSTSKKRSIVLMTVYPKGSNNPTYKDTPKVWC